MAFYFHILHSLIYLLKSYEKFSNDFTVFSVNIFKFACFLAHRYKMIAS